jgi:hypothetical protein
MPTQLKITITKEILQRSRNCGTERGAYIVGNNCAIATALVEMFPNVYVTGNYIFPFGNEYEEREELRIPLPVIAQQFIKLFDGFHLTPKLRLLLPAFEFSINISDKVIEQINIDELRELIAGERKFLEPVSCEKEPEFMNH